MTPRLDPEPAPAPAPAADTAALEEARKARKRAQNELKNLPGKLEKLETELHQLDQQLTDGALYTTSDGKKKAAKLNETRQRLQTELQGLYERWEQLESLAAGD